MLQKVKVRIKKLFPEAKLPVYGSGQAAGADFSKSKAGL